MQGTLSAIRSLVLRVLVVITLLLTIGSSLPAATASGPITPLDPAEQAMTPAEATAQQLALTAPAVLQRIGSARAEVFEVFPFVGPYDPAYAACADGSCYQVDVYDFTHHATITAIVHNGSGKVLDVWQLDGTFPLINQRLFNRAIELIRSDADVAAALGFVPDASQIRLMDQNHMDTQCDGSHLCAGATFYTDSGAIWVLVDLTEDKIAKIWWSDRPQDMKSALYNPKPEVAPEDCNTTIHVNRNGWNLDYRTTPTDSLEITNLTFDVNGQPQTVATRMKLIEWHAHYPGNWGYRDYTGCGGSGGGFPIYPYANTEVRNLPDGFAVVQDFRMNNWGASCNYRYEQHFQFFNDGRFRVATAAYGQGCGDNQAEEATYRPVVRIDIAANGDTNDTLAVWNGSGWTDQTNEFWMLQSAPYTVDGYRYRVKDASGIGYYIEPGQGQFGDAGTGDNAYLYVTQHKASEGDADMPAIGACCNASHVQGPDQYLNNESISNQNIVIWYVPQSETITTWRANQPPYPKQYCWTDNVNNTWPCFSGPMFVPTSLDQCSAFDFDCNFNVDANDITAVASHWGCVLGEVCYEVRFDLNLDEVIDVRDVLIDAARWGCTIGQACYVQ